MSMISGLIDKLRKSEQGWNQSNMFELAHMCREAADTITELRGALQVASVDYRHLKDENAKLRLQIHWLKKGDAYAYEAGYHNGATNYELDHCPSCKNMADLQDVLDENAKLRELVDYMTPIALYAASERERDRMRELGIEADG